MCLNWCLRSEGGPILEERCGEKEGDGEPSETTAHVVTWLGIDTVD